MAEKEHIILRLFNGKVVAIIAMFVAIVYALPLKGSFYLSDIRWAILWFIGGIFVWKNQTWAAILLALFASYDFIVHLIPHIRFFELEVLEMKNEIENLPESLIYKLGITVYSIGAIVESYIICYALKKVIMNLKSKKKICE